MDIKGIIFDFGGTLDTGGDHWSYIIKEGWQKAGVVENDALFREAYVYGEQELERTQHVLPQHDFSDLLKIKISLELGFLASSGHFPPAMVEDKAQEIADYCLRIVKENISKIKPVLLDLNSRFSLVIVSNFYGNLENVLKELDILDLFKKVIDSSVEGVRKPDEKLFEIGVKALDLNPENVLVVGDSVKNDIIPARKLGCKTLLLHGKKWDNEILSIPELNTINNLEEILEFLA